jgi:regulator of replication initiation timing
MNPTDQAKIVDKLLEQRLSTATETIVELKTRLKMAGETNAQLSLERNEYIEKIAELMRMLSQNKHADPLYAEVLEFALTIAADQDAVKKAEALYRRFRLNVSDDE